MIITNYSRLLLLSFSIVKSIGKFSTQSFKVSVSVMKQIRKPSISSLTILANGDLVTPVKLSQPIKIKSYLTLAVLLAFVFL